jgi:hypothetical protein
LNMTAGLRKKPKKHLRNLKGIPPQLNSSYQLLAFSFSVFLNEKADS